MPLQEKRITVNSAFTFAPGCLLARRIGAIDRPRLTGSGLPSAGARRESGRFRDEVGGGGQVQQRV